MLDWKLLEVIKENVCQVRNWRISVEFSVHVLGYCFVFICYIEKKCYFKPDPPRVIYGYERQIHINTEKTQKTCIAQEQIFLINKPIDAHTRIRNRDLLLRHQLGYETLKRKKEGMKEKQFIRYLNITQHINYN